VIDQREVSSGARRGSVIAVESVRLRGVQLTDLPLLHATLNGIAAVLLVAGWILIRAQPPRRYWKAHRAVMLTALGFSVAFLISYLYYHSQVGSVAFRGQGAIRKAYFTILLTHTVLAAAVPFLATVTLSRAFRRRYPQHRAIARWTLPIWLYVSVTGVVIYWMLYRLEF
jgi:uncharacterized membrane protein YozB (DUF420 family)